MEVELIDKNVFRVPDNPNCRVDPRGLGVLFMKRMKKFKDNVAQIDAETGQTLTHGEVLLQSIRVAQHLEKLGAEYGDIIVICVANSMDSSLPLIAGFFLGVTIAPLDPSLPRGDVLHLLNLVKPKFIFVGEECVDTIESCVNELNFKTVIIVHGETQKHIPFSNFLVSTEKEEIFEATPAKSICDTPIIYFSSGTTGFPKGICSSHRSLQYNQEAFMQTIDPSVILVFSTFYWISASMSLIINILSGTTRILVKRFDENSFKHILDKYKVTFIFSTPFSSYKLTKMYKPSDFNSKNLHSLMLVGAKLSGEQMLAVKQLFPNTIVCNGYGMTEINGGITYYDEERDKQFIETKFETSGRPTSGFTYKIVDLETRNPVGMDQHGELRLKGDYMMTGYYNNPEATKAAYDEDGFFCTGDIAYYDADYFIYIVGRAKEVMRCQDYQVIPAEVEYLLMSHPEIEEAIVVGIPNDVDGEHPTACLILKENATVTSEDIIKYYNDKIQGFEGKKLRGGLYVVDKIPVTLSGKPMRRKLREQILNGTAIKL